jgi:MFS family permease
MGYFLTADLGSIAFGFAAKRLVSPGRSVEKARKVILILASLLCLIATPIVFRPGRQVMVPLYCLVGAGIMGVFAMWYAYIQEIAPGHMSKCLGLIGATAWFINSKLHPLVGHFADTHSPAMGKFAPMILVAGMLPLLGALFALTWPDNHEPEAA